MKTKKIFLAVMILATAVACSKKSDVISPDDFQSEIRLGSVMQSDNQSKVAYKNDSPVLDLQFLRKDIADVTDKNYAGVKPFVGNRATTGAITFGVKQFYNPDGTTATCLTSYYPAGTLLNDQLQWAIDGKTDVMTSDVISVGTSALPVKNSKLNYRHELTKVEVIFQAATVAAGVDLSGGWGNIESIKVKSTAATMSLDFNGLMITAGTFDALMPMWAADYATPFAPVALPANGNTTVNAAAMIVPKAGELIVFEIKTTGQAEMRTVVAAFPAGEELERGNCHKITLTFKNPKEPNPIEVSASTIEDWGTTGAAGTGDVQ